MSNTPPLALQLQQVAAQLQAAQQALGQRQVNTLTDVVDALEIMVKQARAGDPNSRIRCEQLTRLLREAATLGAIMIPASLNGAPAPAPADGKVPGGG